MRALNMLATSYLLSFVACNSVRPEGMPDSANTLTVCEAGKANVGARIRVSGEFNGFDYSSQSKMFVVATSEICNDRGAGLVFTGLWSRDESSRAANLRPRGKRDSSPGDPVTVEGTVKRVEEGRFVYLESAIVK